MIIFIFTNTKYIQLFMAVHVYLWCWLTRQNSNNVIGRETLVQCFYYFQHLGSFVFYFYLFLRMQTVITVTAVLCMPVLTKIMHQHLTAAHRSLSKCQRFIDQLGTYLTFAQGLITH